MLLWNCVTLFALGTTADEIVSNLPKTIGQVRFMFLRTSFTITMYARNRNNRARTSVTHTKRTNWRSRMRCTKQPCIDDVLAYVLLPTKESRNVKNHASVITMAELNGESISL